MTRRNFSALRCLDHPLKKYREENVAMSESSSTHSSRRDEDDLTSFLVFCRRQIVQQVLNRQHYYLVRS